MADAPIRTPTGKQVKTYYNAEASTPRATPDWTEITNLRAEKFDKGQPNFFTTDDRALNADLKQQSAHNPLKLTAVYRRVRGVTDDVWTALIASEGVAATPIEIAVADGDITLDNTRYDRFFCKMHRISEDRAVGKFLEIEIEFNEVEHYEGTDLCPPMFEQVFTSS